MSCLKMLSLVAIVLTTLQLSSGQDCVIANSDGADSLPSFGDPDNKDSIVGVNPIQVIIKSYRFQCCGKIGGWAAYVQPGGGGHTNAYSIKFQIWRPTSENSASYEKIGENSFFPATLTDSYIAATPLPSEQLDFQPGDVVGYYLEDNRNQDGGLQFDSTFTSEELWYATGNSNLQNDNSLEVGTAEDLSMSTNLGPIISISITTTSDCPTPPPTPMVTMAVQTTSSVVPISSTSTPPAVVSPTSSLSDVASSSIDCDGNTGCPVSSTVVLPSTSTPPPPISTLVPSPTPTPSTTLTLNTHPTTDDNTNTPEPAGTPSSNNSGLIVGFVVALLVIIVIAVSAIVIVVVIMKRRQSKQGSVDTTAWSNPSYEDPANITKSTKKSKQKPKAKPLVLNVNGDNSVYDVIGGDYEGIPPALDYTYPTPSPTVKYNRKSEEVFISDGKGGAAYHDQGPDVGNVYDYCGNGSVYHTLESSGQYEDQEESNQYEAPTLPKFRKSTLKNSPFDGHGTYVPTLAQRQVMGAHYELQEGTESTQTYNTLNFFVEDQVFWAPADTANDLYQQLASKKYREIPRTEVTILEQLGSGQFGQVCKGIWSISGNSLQLAVKTLKPDAPSGDKVKFLQEAAIMGQFLHPNVVKLYGVVTVGEPVMICLEIMSNGDLRSYLRSIDAGSSSSRSSHDLQLLFLRFAKEIAAGMEYLSTKAFVHRDLAARNVLINEALSCKIGDFGMARDLMDDTYYTSKGGKIPVKWTAPEALLYKKYSTDSDVWSYAMVLFEIWSVGQKPFSMHTNNEVLKLIQSGHLQAPPPGCPREIYKLMVNCWNPEHQYRPKFGEISSQLRAPATKLLYWSAQDSKLSEGAAVLGASLEEGYKLHDDLREKYKQYESI